MRAAAEPAMLAAMAGEAPLVLRLKLDATGEAIQDRVTTESGWAMPFVGWLGPAAAIELATSAPTMRGQPS